MLNDGRLLITDSKFEDSGSYRCIATNEILNQTLISNSATVKIQPKSKAAIPLEFVNPVQNSSTEEVVDGVVQISMLVNENVTLECATRGRPRPSILWLFTSSLGGAEEKEFAPVEVLRLSPVTHQSNGLYICNANAGDQNLQKVFNITVITLAVLRLTPESVYKPRASIVRFNCSASGYPTPTITWYKDGKLLPISGRHKIMSVKKPSGDTEPGLVISDIISNDTGIYQCFASNRAGWEGVSDWAVLGVTGTVLPAPTEPACLPRTSDSLLVIWRAVNDEEILAYTVHYMLTEGGEEGNELANNDASSAVLKVEPFAQYSIYVKSYCKTGSSEPSQFMTCQGQGAPFSLTYLENGTVVASWQYAAKRYPKVKEWMLQWRMDKQLMEHNVTVDYNVTTFAIPDLEFEDNFEVRLLASRSTTWLQQNLTLLEWTPSSSAVLFSNDSAPDPFSTDQALPSHLSAMATSSTSVQLSWRCEAAERSAHVYIFYVCYSQYAGDETLHIMGKLKENCEASDSNSLEIVNLEPDTLYAFKVQAFLQRLGKGGSFSPQVICKTKVDDSKPIKNVEWSYEDSDTLRVEWSPVSEHIASSQLYTIMYSQTVTKPLEQWLTKNVTGDTSIKIDKLNSSLNTYFIVCAGGALTARAGQVYTAEPYQPPDMQTLGAIIGGVVALLCILLCATYIVCMKRRARRRDAMEAVYGASSLRKSDIECTDLDMSWDRSHRKNPGTGDHHNGSSSRGADEPLLGDVHITENPRCHKSSVPNGKCKTQPAYEGAFDLSRYDEPINSTLETILEADTSTESAALADQPRLKRTHFTDSNMNSETAEELSPLPREREHCNIHFEESGRTPPALEPNG